MDSKISINEPTYTYHIVKYNMEYKKVLISDSRITYLKGNLG